MAGVQSMNLMDSSSGCAEGSSRLSRRSGRTKRVIRACPMAYADDLFLNGRILPLKLKLPPCKQGSWGTGTLVPSPSPSHRSPHSPGAALSFHYESRWEDDMGIDPFMIALENVKCDRKRTDLDDDSDFNRFGPTRSSRRPLFEPRGVVCAQKLRIARLAEEMKETRTEAVVCVPKKRMHNFFSQSKRSVLRKLRIEGSSDELQMLLRFRERIGWQTSSISLIRSRSCWAMAERSSGICWKAKNHQAYAPVTPPLTDYSIKMKGITPVNRSGRDF